MFNWLHCSELGTARYQLQRPHLGEHRQAAHVPLGGREHERGISCASAAARTRRQDASKRQHMENET